MQWRELLKIVLIQPHQSHLQNVKAGYIFFLKLINRHKHYIKRSGWLFYHFGVFCYSTFNLYLIRRSFFIEQHKSSNSHFLTKFKNKLNSEEVSLTVFCLSRFYVFDKSCISEENIITFFFSRCFSPLMGLV